MRVWCRVTSHGLPGGRLQLPKIRQQERTAHISSLLTALWELDIGHDGVFMPRKLANARNQGFSFPRPRPEVPIVRVYLLTPGYWLVLLGLATEGF